MTRALILAAGQGTRLRPYTDDRPKCLVTLTGKPLLEHQLSALRAAGVRDVGAVVGYRREMIEAYGLPTFFNQAFDRTNMVASAMCAASWMDGQEDLLIVYGDIVFRPDIIKSLMDDAGQFCTTIDTEWQRLWELRQEDPLNDAETLKLNANGTIRELGKVPQSLSDMQGQYMGLIKIAAQFQGVFQGTYEQLDAAQSYDGKDLPNMYMTSYLQLLIDRGHALQAVPVAGGWLEVDTVSDLTLFNRMHERGALKDFWQPEP